MRLYKIFCRSLFWSYEKSKNGVQFLIIRGALWLWDAAYALQKSIVELRILLAHRIRNSICSFWENHCAFPMAVSTASARFIDESTVINIIHGKSVWIPIMDVEINNQRAVVAAFLLKVASETTCVRQASANAIRKSSSIKTHRLRMSIRAEIVKNGHAKNMSRSSHGQIAPAGRNRATSTMTYCYRGVREFRKSQPGERREERARDIPFGNSCTRVQRRAHFRIYAATSAWYNDAAGRIKRRYQLKRRILISE